MRGHTMRNNSQILYGDQTVGEYNIFRGRPRMLTRDLFAVAYRYMNESVPRGLSRATWLASLKHGEE